MEVDVQLRGTMIDVGNFLFPTYIPIPAICRPGVWGRVQGTYLSSLWGAISTKQNSGDGKIRHCRVTLATYST